MKKVKKVLSVLLVIAIILSVAPISAFAADEVWDGKFPEANEDATYSGGSGTESDPYLISTARDLAQLSVNTNQIFYYTEGKYFKQTADITLNTLDVFERDENGVITGLASGKTPNEWIPIGTNDRAYYFRSSYDGAGHTVSGIHINTEKDYQGLFGYVEYGTVENIGVEASYIKGGNYVGGVVGYKYYNSTVTNSYNSGTVSGSERVGGVVGSGSVTNCYNTGSVSGYGSVGGVVGLNYYNSTVTNSYNTGSVSGNNYVGGVVGYNESGTVSDCYNSGTVSGTYYVGGVVGYNYYNSTVTNSYNTGSVSGNNYVGGVVGYNYYNSTVTNSYNSGTVSGSKRVGGVVGYNEWNSTVTNSYNTGSVSGYDSVGGVVGHNGWDATVTNSYILDTSVSNPTNTLGTVLTETEMKLEDSFVGFDFVNVWAIESSTGYSYPLFIKNLDPSFGGDSAKWDGSVATGFAGGTGTENDPYLIKTAEQLAFLASSVNSGTSYEGEYIKLENDIILNDNSVKYWVLNASKWTPIGSGYDSRFMGSYDGAGHTVSGIHINTEKDYQGLFGFISGGTVENIGVEASYIKGGNYVGGVVGYNDSRATVTNSYNAGTVSGTYYVGGVVGDNYDTVTDCYNTGSVSGNNYVGGVVGHNEWNSTVTNSYNSGTVSGNNYVGGVVGYNEWNSTVTNSYNTGSVSGNNYVGGVVGYNYYNSTVTNSYNTGSVSGNNYVGGVVGFTGYESTVANSYNTGSVSGSNYVGGVVGYNEWNSTVTNSYNAGTVSGTYYVGGVVGDNYDTVTDCYNTGSVSGYYSVGGVVGYNESGTVSDCYNSGTVSGGYIGGVVGAIYSGMIINCYNTGTVLAYATYSDLEYFISGGVVGAAKNIDHEMISVENCYNIGTVSGSYYSGGVIGGAAGTSVMNCYNSGDISGGEFVGGIAGMISSVAYISDDFEFIISGEVKDCYNSGTVSGSAYVGGIAGANMVAGFAFTGGEGEEEPPTDGPEFDSESELTEVREFESEQYLDEETEYAFVQYLAKVQNCYNIGLISSEAHNGGIVGSCAVWPFEEEEEIYHVENDYDSIINGFYLDTSVSNPTNTFGVALTDAQMRREESFVGFDFGNTWVIDNRNGYEYPQFPQNLVNIGYGIGMIAVRFTLQNNLNPYAGLILRFTDNNDKTYTCFVNNTATTKIIGLDELQSYRVELLSQNGVVFASVEDVVLDENNYAEIEFSELLPRLSASLKVQTPGGTDVSAQCSVRWYFTDSGEYITSNNTVKDVTTGTKLSYDIVLSNALAAEYHTVQRQNVVVGEDNNFVFTLSALPKTTVRGSVKDAAGNALARVKVSFVQQINEGIFKNTVVYTDATGSFTAELLLGQTVCTMSKSNYKDYTWNGSVSDGQDFGEITLYEIAGEYFILNMSRTAADATVPRPLNSATNIRFEVSVSDGIIEDIVVQYPYLIIPAGSLKDGDVIDVIAKDLSGEYLNASANLVYEEGKAQQIDLNFIQHGSLWAEIISSENDDDMALIFDSNGEYIKTLTIKNGAFISGPLNEGSYTAVIMGKSNLLYNLSDAAQLDKYGLAESEDYIKHDFVIEDGKITRLYGISIPALDETALYLTKKDETGFRTAQTSIAFGQLVFLKAEYAFDEETAADVENCFVRIVLPENCSIVPNSLTLDGELITDYSLENGVLTIPAKNDKAVIRLYVMPGVSGKTYSFTANLDVEIAGKTVTQPLGSLSVSVQDMEFQVPSKTSIKENLTLKGKAVADSLIEIYDNGYLIGTTKANSVGSFSAKVNLHEPGEYSLHNIYVKAFLPNGSVVFSQEEELIYDENFIQVSKATMIYRGSSILLDYINPSNTPPTYSYVSGYESFTFKVDFTKNNPEAISDVYVVTTDSRGVETYIPVIYDSASGSWVGTYKYKDSYSIPAKVRVVFAEDEGVSVDQIVTPIIDPSGFVCEAVASNRLKGVTATCYYSPNADGSNAVIWNAADYDQWNPLVTDENGYYEWFVPEGYWQVRFEKDGYLIGYTEWLTVPPPQTDVNFALVSTLSPEVAGINCYENGIEISFSQYMDIKSINSENISISQNGDVLSGSFKPMNAEASFADDSVQYASVFLFEPEEDMSSDTVSVRIANVRNYAGTLIESEYFEEFNTAVRPESIIVYDSINLGFGESRAITIQVNPAEAGVNKTVSVTTDSPFILSVSDSSITTAESGKATVNIKGELPGSALLVFSIDGTDIFATVEVNVANVKETVAAVKSSVANGSVVEKGQTIELSVETPGASIYYTIDGSDPRDESNPARTLYTGPITVSKTTEIKAYAEKEGWNSGPTNTFKYYVNVTVEPLSGTVKIDGDAAFGNTLHSAIEVNGTYTCQWYRGDSVIDGATGDSYTIGAEDIGKEIKLVITATGDYTGTLESSTVTPTKAQAGIPIAPVVESVGTTSITLKAVEGYEYLCGTGEWQSSNIFTGLTPNRGYTIYQRIKETDTHFASEPSAALTATTEKIVITGSVSIVAGKIIPGTILTADVRLNPTDAKYKYGWKIGDKLVSEARSYQIKAEDIGKSIVLTITGTDDYSGTISSNPMSLVSEKISSKTYTITTDGYVTGIKAQTTVAQFLSGFDNAGNLKVSLNGKVLAGTDLVPTGAKIELVYGGKVYETLNAVVMGDINSDGKITSADARLVLRHAAKLETLTGANAKAADINRDGKLVAAEARTILRVAAKLQDMPY